MGTTVLLGILCLGWLDLLMAAPRACRSWLGSLGVRLLGWYLAVHAPVATALCGSLGDSVPQHWKPTYWWWLGARCVLGCCSVTGGETMLTLAVARAWQSQSGVAGWGWKGLA